MAGSGATGFWVRTARRTSSRRATRRRWYRRSLSRWRPKDCGPSASPTRTTSKASYSRGPRSRKRERKKIFTTKQLVNVTIKTNLRGRLPERKFSSSWPPMLKQMYILTYNDRTVTHLHIKWGVALGRTVIGAGTRHLPPSHIHAPVTNQR